MPAEASINLVGVRAGHQRPPYQRWEASAETAMGVSAETSSAACSLANEVAAHMLGNLAGQAVGNAIGVQHGFDWKGLAAAAVSAGVTSVSDIPRLSGSTLGPVVAR